jgi:hypothetical protein
VIAGNRQRAPLAQHRHALVRVGVVADQIAQAQQALDDAALERGEHRRERLAIAVRVG